MLKKGFDGCQNRFELTEFRNEVACSLVANSWNPRNIVRGITHEREVIDDSVRRDAKAFSCVLDTYPLFFDVGWASPAGWL